MKVYESTKPMLPDHKRLAYDRIDWTYTIHDMGPVGKMKVKKIGTIYDLWKSVPFFYPFLLVSF